MFIVASQTVLFPEIFPGVAGIELTTIGKVWAEEGPHELFAVTIMFPLVEFAVVAILVVEEVPAHPPGKVQVYEVAPLTAEMEYVFEVPAQIVVFPVMPPGVTGEEFTATGKV